MPSAEAAEAEEVTSTVVDVITADNTFESFAAAMIQRNYRGYRVRKSIRRKRQAVSSISNQWIARMRRRVKPQWAAPIIQRAWRAFSQKRIFKYYRDLIKFRERGNPAELLRCINYRESQLCDTAAGMHVRFRLGGSTFPPLVFYKIYTHNTITDISTFCPRDYVRETKKTQDDVKMHHYRSKAGDFYEDFSLDSQLREYRKPDGTIGLRDEKGWYQRHENNGWRPVAEKSLLEAEETTKATSRLRMSFSHVPQQRKDELIRKRKQKKREWMAKLYLLGKDGKEPDRGHPSSMADESKVDAALDEMDDDELLKWSEALDFDNYLDSWTRMATSNATEAYIPQNDTMYMEDDVIVAPDSAALFAQNYISSDPFKYGTGVSTVNFRA